MDLPATASIPELLERIDYQGDGIYMVPSATTPGKFYTTRPHGRGYCDCQARVTCWHIRVCKIRRWKILQAVKEIEGRQT